jgi:hypothetical protein
MKIKNLLLFAAAASLSCSAFAQELATGELAFQQDGTPAMVGQPTVDHLFIRGDFEKTGTPKDNQVSFKLGTPQEIQFFLDDDSFYANEKVQALKPIALNSAGTEFYNEVAYNSFQCDIYLPQSMSFIASEDEDGEEIMFTQGDRLPSTSNISWKEKEGRVIDGKNYRVYTVVCSNNNGFGCHLSSKNAKAYRDFYAENNRPRQKYDAPVFGLFLMNANQDQAEGHLDDMIIANQEFGFREAFTADPQWEPNEYRFIYGTGGNNETQRFQLYNRVSLYGSVSVVENLTKKEVNNVKYYNVAGMESNVPFDGINIEVTTYNDGTTKTCKVIK